MKLIKKEQKLEAMLHLYIQSVLLDFENPKTILTLKKAAREVSLKKRSSFNKA